MSEVSRNELAALREQLDQLRSESKRSAAMAGELIVAFGETYRRERRASARDGEDATLLGNRSTLPLGVKDQHLAIPAADAVRAVSATALCSDSSQIVVVRLRFADGTEPLPLVAGEPAAPREFLVRLAAGEAKTLFRIEARTEPLELELCRVGGEPCAVRLQIDGATDETQQRASRDEKDAKRSSVKGTLWKAQELLREGRAERAMEVALAYATDVERPALALLRATLAKDDETWLANVNAYAEQFGIAPIGLRDGAEPRFMRLTADAPRAISGGPLVTVIMPAFNAEKTLELAASSILRQSWAELELIIVDDCSSDCTWNIAQRIAERDPRTKVLRNNVNVGPYVSKNIALAIARGAYITCHDADDWAHPQRLEKQVESLTSSGARAGIASLLRLDERGAFDGFTAIGRQSHDGALRVAHVTCMLEARFMRRYIGHWDSVRFGADGEMLERVESLLGEELVRLRQLSILSLDASSSLTNDRVHGISKGLGLSETRRAYRDAWREWHATLGLENAFVDFPLNTRSFSAPDGCIVPSPDVNAVCRAAPANRADRARSQLGLGNWY